jgi:hypothetical protein
MTRCFGVVPMATSSSLVCPNSCVALTIFSVLAAISRKNRAARSSSVITGLSLGVRLVLRPQRCRLLWRAPGGLALLCIDLMAERANFAPKFGQLSRHLVEILPARHAEHRRAASATSSCRLRSFSPDCSSSFLRMEKALAALVSDQFLVGDFTPFRKRFAPLGSRLAAVLGPPTSPP